MTAALTPVIAKAAPACKRWDWMSTHAISDRAKGLIKLAVTGFDCQSGAADTFHAPI